MDKIERRNLQHEIMERLEEQIWEDLKEQVEWFICNHDHENRYEIIREAMGFMVEVIEREIKTIIEDEEGIHKEPDY